MHFTIERKRLIKMLESVRRKLPGQKRKEKQVRLFACAARVFVEAHGVTAGEEALVLAEGGCSAALESLLGLLKTYEGKEQMTMQADSRSLRFFSTAIPVSNFTPNVTPPGDFVVGEVTDSWVAAETPKPSSRPMA